MAIASLQFPPPIRRRLTVAPRDYERRDRAVELFEAGELLAAVHETLGYLLPALSPHDLAQGPLCFVQGTARVRLRLEDGRLVVSSALMAMREGAQATAVLRYALTRLSATGQLFQPRLQEGVLSLEFGDRLSLLHPLKLIEVLQRLPTESDNHDGWLQQRFGVDAADREPLAALEEAELALALEIWRAHWEAVDRLLLESRRRRSVRFLDSLGSWAANQVRYALPLHGSVRATLNEAADEFTDKDENPNRRDTALSRCCREMRQVGEEELRRCLGHASYAINPLHEGTPSLLSSVLGGQRLQTSGELRAAGRYLESALELVADYLYLLADHSWPETIDHKLQAALAEVSGRPWREVAATLWSHANQIARQFGSSAGGDEEDNDGN
ncbi:MAG: hypothetical protein IT479_06910 [Xanthomonadales bacterium]|nr:hypothetical protein [Xanthomonadales bacterium]MCC6592991.1 hypothetical protein [Xanthomonadales bacterium]MCE7932094.1 hypothetical protein [Xanthomonadales bacterium PRO6]